MITYSNRGFTLIEVLVVIFIISLLASIVIIGVVRESRDKADHTAAVAQKRQIETALEFYNLDRGHYPDEENWRDELISRNYISSIPNISGIEYIYTGVSCGSGGCADYVLDLSLAITEDGGSNGNGQGEESNEEGNGKTPTLFVSEDGTSAYFEVEGLRGGFVSGFEAGKKAVIRSNLSGFNGVSPSQHSRDIETYFLRIKSLGGDFSDDFIGEQGVNLINHIPDHDLSGNGWSTGYYPCFWIIAESGTYRGESAGVFCPDNTDPLAVATMDIDRSDGELSVVSSERPSNRSNGLIFRFFNLNNYWLLEINDAQKKLFVKKYENGVENVIYEHLLGGYDSKRSYILEVVLVGNKITVKLDGEEMEVIEDSTHQSGVKHGIKTTGHMNKFGQFRAFRMNEFDAFGVDVALREPVYGGENVSLNLPAGLFSDGKSSSRTLNGLPMDNFSELDHQPSAGGLIGVFESDFEKILVENSVLSGVVTVEAQFTHWSGVSGVEFVASDGSNQIRESVTSRTPSRYRDDVLVTSQQFNQSGGRYYYQTDLDLTQLSDGPIDIIVRAYPRYGGKIREESWRVYNNSDSQLASKMAGEVGWNWENANQYGGGTGSPPEVYVDSVNGLNTPSNGTRDQPYQTIGYALGRLANLGAVYWSRVVVLDQGPHFIERESNTLFLSSEWVRIEGDVPGVVLKYNYEQNTNVNQEHLIKQIEFLRGVGVKLSNLTLHLDWGTSGNSLWLSKGSVLMDSRGHWHAGEDKFTWDSEKNRIFTPSRKIAPFTPYEHFLSLNYAEDHSLNVSDLRIRTVEVLSDKPDEYKTVLVHGLYDIESWDKDKGNWLELKEPIKDMEGGVISNIARVNWGRGRNLIGNLHSPNVRLYVTDAEINHVISGPSRASLVRNSKSRGMSGDWIQEPRFVIATKVIDFFGVHSGEFHADVVQLVADAENLMIDGLYAEADDQTQMFFFEGGNRTDGSDEHKNWAIINSIFVRKGGVINEGNMGGGFSQLQKNNFNFVFSGNTILGQRVLFRSGTSDFVSVGGVIANNIFNQVLGSDSAMYTSIVENNHFIIGSPLGVSRNSTSGGSFNDLFVNFNNGDFSPLGILNDRAVSPVVEGDIFGKTRAWGNQEGSLGAVHR